MIDARVKLGTKTLSAVDVHVGQRIKQLRIAQHLTLKDVADLIGLTELGLKKIEAGKVRIHASQLFVLAQTFGVGMGEFFCDLGIPSKPSRDA